MIQHFFGKEDKKVIFYYNGKYKCNFTVVRSSIKHPTLVKIVEGLNHFLQYYKQKDTNEYDELARHIYESYYRISNDAKRMTSNPQYKQARTQLLVEHCQLDDYLIDKICEYTKAIIIENDIIERNTKTNVALKNIHINLLSCMAIAIKFTYLYAGLIRGNMVYDEALSYFIDKLIVNVIKIAFKYFDFTSEGIYTEDDIHSYVDNFMFSLISKLWNKQADASFQRKFEEVGFDSLYYGVKNKIAVFSAFKLYTPPLVDESLASKYADSSVDTKDIYYTIDKDWEDFKFVNLNMIKYIQRTLKKIIERQDSRTTVISTNKPIFMLDNTDEKASRKEEVLNEDKLKHLFNLRKGTVVSLFDRFIREIDKYDYNFAFAKKFSISKTHIFNQYVLNKILLCLTGECRVYLSLLGVNAKLLLLLFYLKVKHSRELDFMHETIDIMLMNPSTISMYREEDIEAFLNSANYSELNATSFNTVLGIYISDDNRQLILTKEDFIDLFDYMNNPSRVRNLLFPDQYVLESIEDQSTTSTKPKNKEFIDAMLELAMEGVGR